MKLAPQPVRRNLPGKPAPNVSTCVHCAPVNSARTLANSFAYYHILVSPVVSYNYALFCATARRYLSYFQWLPHSFYRHGGGGTPRPLRWVPARFRSGRLRGNQICPPFVFILLQIPFPATPFFSHPCKSPGGVECNGFRTVSQQRQSERR